MSTLIEYNSRFGCTIACTSIMLVQMEAIMDVQLDSKCAV